MSQLIKEGINLVSLFALFLGRNSCVFTKQFSDGFCVWDTGRYNLAVMSYTLKRKLLGSTPRWTNMGTGATVGKKKKNLDIYRT